MTDQLDEDITREIEQAAARRAEQDQIVETRSGRAGETYIPNTPWRRQDNSPHPVPELDADGGPWRITGQGRHVGSHNGEDYCLEWLPTELLLEPKADPASVPTPEVPDVAETGDEERREREARQQEPDRKTGPVLGVSHDDADREAL